MQDWLADFVKRAGRSFGVEIGHYRPFGPRRMKRIRELGIATVVDVGANAGQYAAGLRDAGYAGRIISLEPLAGAYRDLTAAASDDPLWECLNMAAGAEPARLPFNVASNRTSSSILAMTAEHSAGAPTVTNVATELVTVGPLDELVPAVEPPVMLKLDTQGYEARALAGAKRLLDATVLLECELSLHPLYEGQESFAEMVKRLDRLRFALVDLDPFFYDLSDGRVLAVDGLFVRRSGA